MASAVYRRASSFLRRVRDSSCQWNYHHLETSSNSSSFSFPVLHALLSPSRRCLSTSEAVSKISASGLFKQQALIGGEWRDAASGKTITVTNPATAETVGTVPSMSMEETEGAISVAQKAQAEWCKRTMKERGKLVRALGEELLRHKEELGSLITLEQGKPLKESYGEVVYSASYLELFAAEGPRVYGDIIPANTNDRKLFVFRQPVGVVGIITPWNFPIAMFARKVAPAIVAGCAVVVKPAELTPLSALAFGELANRVGIPPGVINFVTGEPMAVTSALMASDVVRKISFTGSTRVGKILMAQAAETVKRISLELGGNAPFLVFEDADIELAAKNALASKFRNSGQTCVCTNRILVQESVYEKFTDAFVREVEKLKVGNGLEKGVTQGPLINAAAVEKAKKHIADATQKGADIILGGGVHDKGELFFQPTVIKNASREMLSFSEEVFAPVAPIFTFKTEEEAIRVANSTPFGLAAYFFTEDIARAFRVQEGLQYGLVGINEGIISTEVAPFGGVKQSGYGREGSKYGINEYMDMKYVCLGNLA
eukprot:TRINITY_DN2408_c0_g2_i1.p1 TRINITY_DN2408_c0_g2~~TRINITY_DN2408_c0_g2_i1.p1  ORF type:complete len:561 (-),score=141.09 TRINITY_DN2408_c0_g2_i1:399-2030(-)